ncbi:MAG: acyltransferase family protein [Afipia sp.]
MNQQKVQFANMLRGVAAFIVVISHYLGMFWFFRSDVSTLTGLPVLPDRLAPPGITYLFTLPAPIDLGPLGVAIFFLISGFVIPFSFERQSRLQYALARILRIWPTYAVGFLSSVFVLYLANRYFGTSLPFSLGTALSQSILGLRYFFGEFAVDPVVWTLEVEIKFYALAFLIGPLLGRASVMCFAVPAIIWLLALNQFLSPSLYAVSPYLMFMFVGTALNFRFRGKLGPLSTTTTVLALMIGASSILPAGHLYHWSTNCGAALVIFVASMLSTHHFKVSRITTFFANISYPFYVVHSFIGYAVMTILIQSLSVDSTLATFAALLIATGFAWIVHVLVELPTQRLGKKIAAYLPQLRERLGLMPAVRQEPSAT